MSRVLLTKRWEQFETLDEIESSNLSFYLQHNNIFINISDVYGFWIVTVTNTFLHTGNSHSEFSSSDRRQST